MFAFVIYACIFFHTAWAANNGQPNKQPFWKNIQYKLLSHVYDYSQMLRDAIRKGDIKTVKIVITSGFDINTILDVPMQTTALHKAITAASECPFDPCRYPETGEIHDDIHYQIIKCLLEAPQIDVNAADTNGCTPLHYAIHIGKTSLKPCLTLLIKHPNIQLNKPDTRGVTALFDTVNMCSYNPSPYFHPNPTETLDILIKAGASLHTKTNTGCSPFTIYPKLHQIKDTLIAELFTCIQKKEYDSDNVKRVKQLLKQIPFTIKDDNGNTLLHHAAQSGHKDMIGLLYALRAGMIAVENNQGETPVSLAIGHQPIFNLLYNGLAFPPTNVLALEENKNT